MNRKRFLLSLLLTLFMVAIVLAYQQYLSLLLGVVVGGLRILHFWWNDKSRGKLEYQEVRLPRAKRSPEVQARVTEAYTQYESTMLRKKWSDNWRQYVVLLVIAYVVIYYDKHMTFYTFFMTMVTVWVWFQVWLAKRVG